MEQKKTKSWKTIVKRLLVVALVLSLAIPLVPQTMVVPAGAADQCHAGRNRYHSDPDLQVRRAHCPKAGGAGRGGGEGEGPV